MRSPLASTRPRSGAAAPRLRHWLTVVLLFAFVCGDGTATAIQASRGLTSPYLLMVPFLFLALLLMVLDAGRIPVRFLVWATGLGVFAVASLLMQLNLFLRVNLDGYAQLWTIFIAFFAVQDLVVNSSEGFIAALRRGILILHYFVAGYIAVTALTWYLTGFDLSIAGLISRAPSTVNEYYGFRPSGPSREPAWAGFLLTSTFIAVYFSNPKGRLSALVALVAGIAALRSGTAFAFTAIVIAGIVFQRRRGLPAGRALIASVAAAAVMIWLFGERITTVLQGADPSGLMRFDSAAIAWDVVQRSLPVGVGYGNFRDYAEYGARFDSYIDLLAAPEYKSDIAILNLLAELGLGGLVIVGALVALYARGNHVLFWAHLGATLFLAGGLLIPSNVLVAVALGLRERERRRVAGRRPVTAVRPAPWPAGRRPRVVV